jgi:hypothetical protein
MDLEMGERPTNSEKDNITSRCMTLKIAALSRSRRRPCFLDESVEQC